ncbi:MAG: aspartate aminotransferase family protein [Streptomycetaceae bacterium]|jgi:glutamate-1-semialdehyde 2,1-aminomutase|nr:MAG: aspartate aminotransferase family protein [Streptomycetaceae bacterium]
MKTQSHHSQTFRSIPTHSKPFDKSRLEKIMQEQLEMYKKSTLGSGLEYQLATQFIPLGTHSTFQSFEPYPVSIVSAKGAWMTDVDGRKMLDLSMGFGAMLAGHLNPDVVSELRDSLDVGTLFTTPSPLSRDAAERICRRFGIDQVRFTNSGTESTMYAVRTARAYSGKEGVVKVEGGYHGSHDSVLFSNKPSLDKAGPADAPTPVIPKASVAGEVYVVPFNDADALENLFEEHSKTIACFIVEPVLENIGIVLPDEGYLEAVRDLCDKYKVVLIFDEVKTGLTAGPQGAAQRLGVIPDLICLAKSIGGGIPLAAFGGKAEFMLPVSDGRMPHLGTFNGHALAMAAVRAVDKICTASALEKAELLNRDALIRIREVIDEYELPAHTVGFGVKGCITWSDTPVRNYRDYKATNFQIAELSFLWSLNHGVITPPGLDEQWLISLAHGQAEIDFMVNDFKELAKTIRG